MSLSPKHPLRASPLRIRYNIPMSTAVQTAYRLRAPRMWLLRDAPSQERAREIDFHVKSGDYFSTLATIMLLIEDSLADCMRRNVPPTDFQTTTLHQLKDELMHLHGAYTIVQKK